MDVVQQGLVDSTQLENFPVSFFAMVMGLAGLTIAWEKAGRTILVISHQLIQGMEFDVEFKIRDGCIRSHLSGQAALARTEALGDFAGSPHFYLSISA
jgi:hypothetical protein